MTRSAWGWGPTASQARGVTVTRGSSRPEQSLGHLGFAFKKTGCDLLDSCAKEKNFHLSLKGWHGIFTIFTYLLIYLLFF